MLGKMKKGQMLRGCVGGLRMERDKILHKRPFPQKFPFGMFLFKTLHIPQLDEVVAVSGSKSIIKAKTIATDNM